MERENHRQVESSTFPTPNRCFSNHCALCCSLQERLVMSILPRFLVVEMISDMAPMDEFLLPQQFHKIYVHHYKDVR